MKGKLMRYGVDDTVGICNQCSLEDEVEKKCENRIVYAVLFAGIIISLIYLMWIA